VYFIIGRDRGKQSNSHIGEESDRWTDWFEPWSLRVTWSAPEQVGRIVAFMAGLTTRGPLLLAGVTPPQIGPIGAVSQCRNPPGDHSRHTLLASVTSRK
jgi:hypothetical protein